MKTCLATIAACSFAAALFAQTPTPAPSEGRSAFWRGEFPGGTYVVLLRAITSVSTHEYLVDGAARVTELTIDASGSTVARIYALEPVTTSSPLGLGQSTIDHAQQLAKEALSRTGQGEAWKKVVKSYPTTTHAHTVEYRVDSAEDVKKIFSSVDRAWSTGRGGIYRPQSKSEE